MEQPIKDQAAEGQSPIPANEGSADETAVSCDATPLQQQQSGDEKQQAESQAPQTNEAVSPNTAGGSQPSTRPNPSTTPTNNQVGDPVESEPYRWHECTVQLNITLIPDPTNKEHYQTALVGIRTHNDAPIVRRVAAGELLPLPSCIMEMIREMREQLPARADHREERVARAQQTALTVKQSATKTQPAKAKVKPGRHVGAGAPSAKAIEQESFDDDLFSTTPTTGKAAGDVEESEGRADFANEPQKEAASAEASEGKMKQSPTPRSLSHTRHKAQKYDKRGRALDSKSPSTPQNQMSLI